MNIAFAVITCNRLYYLKNCIKSIENFVGIDKIPVIVVDNKTVEYGASEYFQEISKFAHVKRFEDRVPNELYRAMNYVIEHCFKTKIDIVNFLQDDYQYLYRLDSMLPTIVECFKKHKKIGQVNTNMAWKRKRTDKWPIVTINGTNHAILDNKYLVDNGFTRVSIYKKIGLYPTSVISYDQQSEKTFGFGKNRYRYNMNGEIWFGKKTRKLGCVRAISLMPNQTMIFDCAYVRKWLRFGNYFPPPEDFYILPFDSDNINRVRKKHDKKQFCYIEEFAKPWGWTPTTYDKHNHQNIKQEIRGL